MAFHPKDDRNGPHSVAGGEERKAGWASRADTYEECYLKVRPASPCGILKPKGEVREEP